MAISLTKADIDAALPRIATGLTKYLWLQANRDTDPLQSNPVYRKHFNHFYRVRRGPEWQDAFYDLLERTKGTRVRFSEILDGLYRATNRYEASFASKLLATIDPDMPVIDSVVLRNLSLKLPAFNSKDRLLRICQLHEGLRSSLHDFLETGDGRYLVRRFRGIYPDARITEIKMLDLVLWQTRPTVTTRCTDR
jgi:hypothetical protein